MKIKITIEDEGGKYTEHLEPHEIHVGHLMDMTGDVGELLAKLPSGDLQRLRIEIAESAKTNKSYLNLLPYFYGKKPLSTMPKNTSVKCPVCGEMAEIKEPNTKNVNDPENYYAAATLENGNLAEYYDEIVPYECPNDHVFYLSRDTLKEWLKCH